MHDESFVKDLADDIDTLLVFVSSFSLMRTETTCLISQATETSLYPMNLATVTDTFVRLACFLR